MPLTRTRRWWIPILLMFGAAVGGGLLNMLSPALVLLAFLALTGTAIYVLVRGAAPKLGMRGRTSGTMALASAVILVIGAGVGASVTPTESQSNSSADATPRALLDQTTTNSPSPTPTMSMEIKEVTNIPFARKTVDDPNLDVGTTTVTAAGVDGEKTTTYRLTYVNGVEVSREVISEIITLQPVTEVSSRGTRQKVPAPVPFKAPAEPKCHPSYTDVCVPFAADVDCAGGSGNGPAYVDGPLRVVGTDVYDLDRDGDGIACD